MLCSPYKDFPAFFEYFNALIFGTDTVLSFFRCGCFQLYELSSPHVNPSRSGCLRYIRLNQAVAYVAGATTIKRC